MNKKQFAIKLMASMLSAYFLVPCTSTFGVDSQPNSEETVSLSEKNQETLNDEDAQEDEDEQEEEDTQEDKNKQKNEDAQKSKDKENSQKKSILRNPGVQVVGGGIGLGILAYGLTRVIKHFRPAEDRSGWTELHHAAEADNLEAFNGLTRADQRLRQRDTRGRTPFYIAVKYHPESQIIRNWLDGLDLKLHTVGADQVGDELISHIIYDTLVTAVRNDDVQTLTNLVNTVMTNYTPNPEIEPNPAIYFGFEFQGNGRVFDIALREHHTAAAQCLLAVAPSGSAYGVTYNSAIHADPQARLAELRELKRQGLSLKSLAANPTYIFNALYRARTQPDIFRFYIDECNALSHLAPFARAQLRAQLMNSAELKEYFDQKCEGIPYVAPQQ